VAAFLMHPETLPPLTLSVEGAWGSGKSSFMLQLQEQIEAKKAITVWFNAWRHDRDEELWAAFALHFTKKLSSSVRPLRKKCLLQLKLAYQRFDWKRGWFSVAKFAVLGFLFLLLTWSVSRYWFTHGSSIQQLLKSQQDITTDQKSQNSGPPKWDELLFRLLIGSGGLAAYLLLAFGLFRTITKIVGNPLTTQLTKYLRDPKYETHAAFIDTFHDDFKRLVDIYSQERKIFVFIDDLDRCEVPKSAELMQALNLLISEKAPVFYVLGLDREKVAAGLAAKYEKLLPYLSSKKAGTTSTGVLGTEFGYSFLEKFIQIPFLVPQPGDPDVDKLLDSLGSRAERPVNEAGQEHEVDAGLLVELSVDSDSVRDIVKMIAPSFEYNPRRLKQFVNVFRLRALLASQTGLFGKRNNKKETDPLTFEQLGKLVAIMLRWPLLLVDLETDPGLLARLQKLAWRADRAVDKSDPTLEYWASKSNLVEMIAFPSRGGPDLPEATKAMYGLDRIDIERFLRIAPPVRGRALLDNPLKTVDPPTPPTGVGESEEENRDRDTRGFESPFSESPESDVGAASRSRESKQQRITPRRQASAKKK
jgi:hypothetical protein